MRLRPAACLAALTVALIAAPGHAAPLRFTDPVGDSVGRQSALDIVWVQLATAGAGKGARYVPSALVVTMRLNNVPVEMPGIRYMVSAIVEGCDQFALSYPGVKTLDGSLATTVGGFADIRCGGAPFDPRSLRFSVDGASLKWQVALAKLPGMRVGARFSSIAGATDAGTAASAGMFQATSVPTEIFDVATTPAVWTMR